MRNLNGYEIGGRTLRVDNACTEKSRMEMQQLLQGPQIENPFGDPCPPEQAPEVITKTVASLPPEQMFELMKQMKLCIQNNPGEARQMLLLNPQLAYALLQAMVVMKIIDPQMGLSMLFKANQVPPVFGQNLNSGQPQIMQSSKGPQQPDRPGPSVFQPSHQPSHDIDLRNVDPRMNNGGGGGPGPMMDHRAMNRIIDQDMRAMSSMMPNPVPPPNMDPRSQRSIQPVPFPVDPRQQRGNTDPRLRPGNIPQINQPIPQAVGQEEDHEKAALIMQVLQLSDEQIALLPHEQRASILVLKEQIAKSSHR